jgi:hypothetical protein
VLFFSPRISGSLSTSVRVAELREKKCALCSTPSFSFTVTGNCKTFTDLKALLNPPNLVNPFCVVKNDFKKKYFQGQFEKIKYVGGP